MDKELNKSDTSIVGLQMLPVDTKKHEFQQLMSIYEKAMNKTKSELTEIQKNLSELYNYNVINTIECRIKSPDSIIKKMKKKKFKRIT